MKHVSKPFCVTAVIGAAGVLLVAALHPLFGGAGNEVGKRPWTADESTAVVVPPESIEALKDRAFWGAPPPMPHSFTKEWDDASCLNCHAAETNIAKRQQAISPIPHGFLSQCQQCHVRGLPTEESFFRESAFVGLGAPGKGSRATDVSPPTIPHHTFMRENCLSCHGPAGEQRVTTPHPYRSQCQQCHVPQADRQYSRFPLR